MTFTPPKKTVEPSKLLIAYDILEGANKLLADLKTYRKEQYELFWYDQGSLRSFAEINDILIEMDAAKTGQSGQFFDSAVELVELILAIEPGSLEPYEWWPKYDYDTDANGQIRMIEPDLGGGE